MGASGVGLFHDDVAVDVRRHYLDLLASGVVVLALLVLFFAAPLLVLWLAAAALAATGPMRTIAAGLLGTVLVARAAVALAGRWRAGVGPWGLGLAADAVLGDALLGRAFVRALRGRTVRWRGRALTVGRDGVLVEA